MAFDNGLARLKKRLAAIPREVKVAVGPALEKSGNEIADTMRALAPVDTGALEESIAVTTAGNTTPPYSQPGGSTVVPEGAVMITAGNSGVRYAHLVEHGTVDTTAQPFFWPGYRLARKRATTRIRRALSAAVKKGWQS